MAKMSMVEKVAKAIYDELEEPIGNQDYSRQLRQWELATKLARAAIEAIADVSLPKEIEAAAWAKVRPYHDIPDQEIRSRMPGDFFRIAWPAMIDAALNGKEV